MSGSIQSIYDRLIAWIDAITPSGVTVIASNPNAPMPPRPVVALDVQTNVHEAYQRLGINDAGLQPVTQWRRITVALQIFGRSSVRLDAEEIAQSIADRLAFSEEMNDYLGRSLTFSQVINGPQSVNEVIGTEWEPRVVMDLSMYASRDIIYDVGHIETVEYNGTIGGIETTGQVTISKG